MLMCDETSQRRDLADGSVELCCAPETESEIFRLGPRAGAADALPRVRCPVTVAVGGRDIADGPGSVAASVANGVVNGRLETCVSSRYVQLLLGCVHG